MKFKPSLAFEILLWFQTIHISFTGERSSSGLLEWESINDAMEALAMVNHYQMKNPSKFSFLFIHQNAQFSSALQRTLMLFSFCLLGGPYPYTLKLCFSTTHPSN